MFRSKRMYKNFTITNILVAFIFVQLAIAKITQEKTDNFLDNDKIIISEETENDLVIDSGFADSNYKDLQHFIIAYTKLARVTSFMKIKNPLDRINELMGQDFGLDKCILNLKVNYRLFDYDKTHHLKIYYFNESAFDMSGTWNTLRRQINKKNATSMKIPISYSHLGTSGKGYGDFDLEIDITKFAKKNLRSKYFVIMLDFQKRKCTDRESFCQNKIDFYGIRSEESKRPHTTWTFLINSASDIEGDYAHIPNLNGNSTDGYSTYIMLLGCLCVCMYVTYSKTVDSQKNEKNR